MATACDVLLEECQPSRCLDETSRETETQLDTVERNREDESKREVGAVETKVAKKKKKKTTLTINLTNCKYDSVSRMAKKFGMKVVNGEEAEDWVIYWTDMALPERVSEIKPYQKVNHFPGMNEICRKDFLARNMNRMLKLFPKEYNCFPRTWTLPADFGDFQAYCLSKKNKVFIAKPGSGCQGKGIFLFRGTKDIKPGEHLVCQQYISKPFLIDKFKFDLRIYILVTSCDPLRIYVHHDGLVRLGTVKYKEPNSSNLDELCMHLTNYAINKHSKDFVRDEDSGSKRRITTLNKWFADNGYDTNKIWADIDDVIIKTLIAAHPVVYHNYRSTFPNHTRGSACFEILGFDILLDRKLKPWLIEVNRSPSFQTDSPLDKEVKEALIYDTLNLIDLFANDRKRCLEEEKQRARDRLLQRQRSKESSLIDRDTKLKYEAQFEKYEETHCGGYRRIYPLKENEEKYQKYFNQNTSLCTETIASRARADMARQLREQVEAKQKELEKFMKPPKGNNRSETNNTGSESPPPGGERKRRSACSSSTSSGTGVIMSARSNRRSFSFRIPPPSSGRDDVLKKRELGDNYTEKIENNDYKEDTRPLTIIDEEELERLAGLELRESIVRSMGVSEQLRSMLESEPNTRAQTPRPQSQAQNRGGVRNYEPPNSYLSFCYDTSIDSQTSLSHSQPSLHFPPIISQDRVNLLSTHSTPEHKRIGMAPRGLGVAQLPGYRQSRALGAPTDFRSETSADYFVPNTTVDIYKKSLKHSTPSIYRNHGAPPTLELCGNAISLTKGSNKRQMVHKKVSETGHNNNYRYSVRNPSLTIQGLSVNDRIKHLKYLSTSYAPPP